ncbi:MAG TPA: hypothetical protein VLB50_05360 [Ignavibacteriaceae bacterium]|nr:hypothetical protein [Ignavibacteriaceae bacterium]
MLRGKLNDYFEILKDEELQFMNFLKAKYPFFHKSNFFFRDLQYGIRKYFGMKGIKISYTDSERLTRELASYYEVKQIFIPVSNQTWSLNYPEFVTTVPGDPL